eukprot:ANDGO_02968.mRNA.1 Sphingomyelinase phosphodiesterase D
MSSELLLPSQHAGSTTSTWTKKRKWTCVALATLVITAVAVIVLSLTLTAKKRASPSQSPSDSVDAGYYLQLSDMHIDPLYDPACDSTSYCRPTSGSTVCMAAQTVNPYGRFGCDAPLQLLDATLAQMKLLFPNPDFILLTGDFSAHHLPNASITLQIIKAAVNLISEYFPNTMMIPVLGNNDVVPDYCLSCGPNPWLADLWSVFERWLPQSAKATFLTGAYYSISPRPGVRVLGLNTLFFSQFQVSTGCDEDALALERQVQRRLLERWFKDASGEMLRSETNLGMDVPCGQDTFILNEIKSAYSAGDRVLITGHIPPGVEAYDGGFMWNASYVSFYLKMLESVEAQATVASQHFGHYHVDDFRLMYNTTTGFGPFGSALLAPAVSPVYLNNPTFRMFTYDRQTFRMLNVESWFLLLEASNALRKPQWFKLYDAQSAYGLSDLSTASLLNLRNQLQHDLPTAIAWSNRRDSYYLNGRKNLFCALETFSPDAYNLCRFNTSLILE